ncbi:MAG TPA: LysR family transcriptional regulator [Gammaproteobacteria bacterium]|nr:LysR family transcriptional regulator [Gammaproteobacteria bacterium]
MQFRLRDLEVLDAVLRTGSTLAAAECLHVTQPVVSRSLKHAEQRLGYDLFRRHRGRLEPTPEAQALIPELNSFFAHWRKIQDYALHLADRPIALRVAVNPALIHVLPEAVAQVNRKMRGIRFQLLTLHTTEIIDKLFSGQLDIGISQGGTIPDGIAAEELGQGEFVMLAPRTEKNSQTRLSLKALTAQPFVGLQTDAGLGKIIGGYLHERGIEPSIVARVQTYRLAVSLVEQGLGATIVDRFTADTANEALVVRAPLADAPTFAIHALYHPRHIAGNAEKLLCESIAKLLRGDATETAAATA